jgi:cell division septation protein DedD
MSDTFAFRAVPVPLRRRVRPRVVKAVGVALVVLIAMTWFARLVIRSERESFARAERHQTSANLVDTISGAGSLQPTVGVVTVSEDDLSARRTARDALEAARKIAAGPTSFIEAGPGELAKAAHGLTFTDGPSPVPSVVSVAATGSAWAAAVMSDGGRCFYIRVGAGEGVTYGSSVLNCTGAAALEANDPSW